MNKLLIEILPIIDKVVEHTTKDYNDRHEIKQTLVLKLYSKKKVVKRLHKEGNLTRWLYKVASNIKIDLYRQRKSLPVDLNLPILAVEDKPLTDIDKVKTLDEMLNELTDVERLWINLYLESGVNFRECHRRSNISRLALTERIKTILEKWKHLDIYLEP